MRVVARRACSLSCACPRARPRSLLDARGRSAGMLTFVRMSARAPTVTSRCPRLRRSLRVLCGIRVLRGGCALPLGLRFPPWRSRHLAMLAPALRAPVASDDHASRSRFTCVFRRELPRSSACSPRRSRGSPAVAFTLRIPLPRARRGHWRITFARSRDHLAVIACASDASAHAPTDRPRLRSPCGSRFRARRGHWRIRARPLSRPPCDDRVRCPRVRSSSHARPRSFDTLRHPRRRVHRAHSPRRSSRASPAPCGTSFAHSDRPAPTSPLRARPRAPCDARVCSRIRDVSTSRSALACKHLAMPALAREPRHPDVSARGHPPAKTSPAFRPRPPACILRCLRSFAREHAARRFLHALARLHLAMPAFDRVRRRRRRHVRTHRAVDLLAHAFRRPRQALAAKRIRLTTAAPHVRTEPYLTVQPARSRSREPCGPRSRATRSCIPCGTHVRLRELPHLSVRALASPRAPPPFSASSRVSASSPTFRCELSRLRERRDLSVRALAPLRLLNFSVLSSRSLVASSPKRPTCSSF